MIQQPHRAYEIQIALLIISLLDFLVTKSPFSIRLMRGNCLTTKKFVNKLGIYNEEVDPKNHVFEKDVTKHFKLSIKTLKKI